MYVSAHLLSSDNSHCFQVSTMLPQIQQLVSQLRKIIIQTIPNIIQISENWWEQPAQHMVSKARVQELELAEWQRLLTSLYLELKVLENRF